jgi:hypothetical protein
MSGLTVGFLSSFGHPENRHLVPATAIAEKLDIKPADVLDHATYTETIPAPR